MTGGVWVASYVLLWIAVLILTVAVVVLLRQIGVLHSRLQPTGVHHAGEGPMPNEPAPAEGWFDFQAAPLTLVAFTSPNCSICESLAPSLQRLQRTEPDVNIELVRHGPDSESVFEAYSVRSTPYFVAVDAAGVVRGGGVANSLEQVESLIETASATSGDA